jgi:hypothetical protein
VFDFFDDADAGIFILMGSTFIGGNCNDCTLGGSAKLPGNV